ncbi:DUF951 domain-containing protein [Acholeplasma sp. OttesenSCG-928-E16]|nr:DUF951 domain-containing protein [Acholeplasma sp. OttesenSCG-928-E16]
MIFEVGKIIETKKPHSCKGNKWQILKTGIDIKLKCISCGREIVVQKYDFEKKIKK